MSSKQDTPILKLYKAYQKAPEIRRAEKSAAGTMPAAALQYCEAMRRASATGWYVYPPKDISLYSDGYEVFIYEGDAWIPLKSYTFEQEFRDAWNENAPESMAGLDPPMITELFVRNTVQIWSGYFVETAPDWSLHVRSPVNYGARSSILHYEAIVDTDIFKPSPLFINFQIVKTDTEIHLSKDRPLFQIMPVYRAKGLAFPLEYTTTNIFEAGSSDRQEFDWGAMRKTVRHVDNGDERRPGSYSAKHKKIGK